MSTRAIYTPDNNSLRETKLPVVRVLKWGMGKRVPLEAKGGRTWMSRRKVAVAKRCAALAVGTETVRGDDVRVRALARRSVAVLQLLEDDCHGIRCR